MATEVRRGDVVLATFPFTDLSSAKRRPALVVSASDREGPDFILAFITSKASKPDLRDIFIDPSDPDFAASGLRAPSLVRCGKLMTLNRALLIGRLGVLTSPIMDKVDVALKMALALR